MFNRLIQRRKVKSFFIHPEFQLNFVVHTLGIAAVLITIFYSANMWLFLKFYQKGFEMGATEGHEYFRFIDEMKSYMNWVFAGTGAIATFILGAFGVRYSHRVAGPLYRIKKHMHEVAEEKNANDCNLRKGDYFHDVADAYNRLLHRWRKDHDSQGGGRSAA